MFRLNSRVDLPVLLICSLGSVPLLPVPVSADVAASRCRLGPWANGIKVGPGMDTSGRILRDCTFVGLDLRNASFDGAHLGGCEIYQCDLRNASFKNTIFTGLRWGDCNLEGADLTDAVLNGTTPIHGVTGYDVRLTAAQLMSTRSYKTKNVSNCIIWLSRGSISPEFDFRDADLRGAVLGYCDLRKSDFVDARIRGANFYQSRLTGQQVTSTLDYKGPRSLVGISFGDVEGRLDFTGCDLTGSSWIPSQANITNANITRCLLGCPLSSEQLRSTQSYQDGRLVGISFYDQDFSGLDLSAQDLSGCYFRDCRFVNTRLDDAIITNAAFSLFRKEDLGLTPDQIRSTWNYKHGRMVGIELPRRIAAALELRQLSGTEPTFRSRGRPKKDDE